MEQTVTLKEKFFGCIAGVHIGSAMGAAVEGMHYEDLEKKHGRLDTLLPYRHYVNTSNWVREPGTTEDGIERQKLLINAIVRKKDRVTAEDVRQTWITDMNPAAPGTLSEPFEGELLALAKTCMPAGEIGRFCDYSGLVSFARSCHPIGLINAGDIDGAIRDVLDAGRLYQVENSRGLQWAAVTAIAIAAATKPGATVDSVIGAILDNCDRTVRPAVGVGAELRAALDATAKCRDYREIRTAFHSLYAGWGIPYAFSFANEIVTKAVCLFRMVNGDLREAIVAAVNAGRDTDCTAAVTAGITGALSGGGSLLPEWVEQVDRATSLNPYTCSQRTIREQSDALYEAFRCRCDTMKTYLREMERT